MPDPTDSRRTVHRTCPLCEATCGLSIDVEGDRVARIRGDERDVFSRGYMCPKGPTLKALHEDPDRLRRPLVRRGGRHVEVDWDEAFAHVERVWRPVVERHGPGATAIYLGNPNVHNIAGSIYARPLIRSLETRNVFSASTADQMPKHVSSGLLFGDPGAIPVPDLDRTDHLLMLGANPLESNGSLCTAPDWPGRLKAIRARGGKVVVIDPRRTRTARLADEHHFVRPGSDAALLLAMLHTLFADGSAGAGELTDRVSGLAEVERAVARFSPERVAGVCGIEAAAIRRLARELAAAPTAAVYGRIGTHTTPFGTLASWAVDALNLLTGNLDRPGGAMFPRPAHGRRSERPGGRGMTLGRWKSRVRGLPEARGELPVAVLAEEIDTPGEGRIRALVTVAGNPVLSTPDSDRLDAALADLEAMVCVDPYCNETTRHADVILPPPSPLERSHYDLAFATLSVRNVARYSPAVFAAEGPSEAEILARLALLFGGQGAQADPAALDALMLNGVAAHAVSDPDSPVAGRDPAEIAAAVDDRPAEERILDLMLRLGPWGEGFGDDPGGLSLARLEQEPHGVDLGPLAPRLPGILSTPSERIELAAAPILGDLERLDRELDAPGGPGQGLLLVGRRDLRSNNSWMHNLPELVSGRDRCTLHVHPDDASRLGLESGGKARVASRVGELTVPVEVTPDVMAGVVSLPHGWGHDRPGSRLSVAREHAGVNKNRLVDTATVDPLSGNAVLTGVAVEVKPG
ncbi:MAG: molybdopterin-dependent oxidoreductase [Myxococcota bacterium]